MLNMKIENNSNLDLNKLKDMLDDFYSFAKKRLNFSIDPHICCQSDHVNAKYALGKTAFYNPEKKSITIFVDGRHPKDIMRSLSHELVHHAQNCDGQFDQGYATKEGYAQEDNHLREMEKDAYLRGNMCFRDWEDRYRNR